MPRFARQTVIGMAIVGVLLCAGAAYVTPTFRSTGYRAKRAEVPGHVAGIATSERAYQAIYDHYLAVGSRAEAEAELLTGRAATGAALPRAWKGGAAWDELFWKPDGAIRGAYWVEVPPTRDSFEVFGIVDLDGDGENAEFRWDPAEEKAKQVTPDSVF
jgi:hypothetical protein